MRIKLYTRGIELKNGKEVLYRDMAVEGIHKDVEAARLKAEDIIRRNIEFDKEHPEYGILKDRIGINFKIKDLDSKQVIETFEIRY